MIDEKAPPNKRLRRGAVIRVQADEKNNWRIVQMPEVEAAFLAADPRDGAIRALVGGFDFNRNKFNHVTQAWRQPGSSFKPFIYSAALEKGFTPASVINDEPISFPSAVTGSQAWEPKNYDGKYEGPMRMRTALAKSKNMVSIRLLQASGVHFVQDYITRFGFAANKHPPYLTMALGAGSVTPWEMVTAYAVFANGGYRIRPYVVREIQDNKRQVLARAEPITAGEESLRAIDPRNAYLMDSMLRDVTIYGTAARAAATLKRRDLAGKTGPPMSTSMPGSAATSKRRRLLVDRLRSAAQHGRGETGGTAALPTWISYMARALKDVPEAFLPAPEGIVSVASPASGKGPAEELFYQENAPAELEPEPPADQSSKPED
jgi:penicillin-binding protein 1A